jgi:type IV pilus assembly protein PilQ
MNRHLKILLLFLVLPAIASWGQTQPPVYGADPTSTSPTETPSNDPDPLAGLGNGDSIELIFPEETDDTGSASFGSDETISVDFPDEEIRTILRNVADLYDLNLVIPDTLQGNTSIKLRNVTWDEVFDVTL